MGLSLSIKMNRERLPTSGARASAKVTRRLTLAELRALDRFCAERLLTCSQVVRWALKAHLLERVIGPEAGMTRGCPRMLRAGFSSAGLL
jgi:hypothetical protein